MFALVCVQGRLKKETRPGLDQSWTGWEEIPYFLSLVNQSITDASVVGWHVEKTKEAGATSIPGVAPAQTSPSLIPNREAS